jgi:hypothetical protein
MNGQRLTAGCQFWKWWQMVVFPVCWFYLRVGGVGRISGKGFFLIFFWICLFYLLGKARQSKLNVSDVKTISTLILVFLHLNTIRYKEDKTQVSPCGKAFSNHPMIMGVPNDRDDR